MDCLMMNRHQVTLQRCMQMKSSDMSICSRRIHHRSVKVFAEASPSRRPALIKSNNNANIILRIPSIAIPAKSIDIPSRTQPSHKSFGNIEKALPKEVFVLIGLTAAVSFICSIDRAAMSTAILPMSDAFHWDDSVKGAVASSFFLGYTISNLAGSYLSTRFSPRGVLSVGVFLWSCFTLFTPMAAAASLPDLLAVRGAMGLGEGVAYPSIQNLVQSSVPSHARSRALAFIYSGHQLGTIASYLLAPYLISEFGWESVFFIFGSLGFFWLLGWVPVAVSKNNSNDNGSGNALNVAPAALNTDSTTTTSIPEERNTNINNTLDSTLSLLKNKVDASHIAHTFKNMFAHPESQKNPPLNIQDIPWRDIGSNRAFWAIVAAQVTVGIGGCLSFSWLPTYYSEVYNVDVAHSAAFCLVPFIFTVMATNASGWIADGLVNNDIMSKTNTRKLMQCIASFGPAICLLKLASHGEDNGSITDAVAIVTSWLSLGGFSAAGYGSNHQEISRRYAGLLFGVSNGIASLAGSASIYTTGLVLKETHDWGLIFTAAALMYMVGAGVYLRYASADEQFDT